jgi:hypothetical protein
MPQAIRNAAVVHLENRGEQFDDTLLAKDTINSKNKLIIGSLPPLKTLSFPIVIIVLEQSYFAPQFCPRRGSRYG